MSKYFCAEQVSACFKRLATGNDAGKKALERTSGLMYFLAFDAVSKAMGETYIDLNPDKADGQLARKKIEIEFTKLVMLGQANGLPYQVFELGKFEIGGTIPEKRISSNFFTVPLKKASEQTAPYYYPKRPAPLMDLGGAATRVKWGIALHRNWAKNLPLFFTEIPGSTYFTDLAVFVMRDATIPETHAEKYVDTLSFLLEKRYSTALADFWKDKIKMEYVLAQRHFKKPFCDTLEPLIHKLCAKENHSTMSEVEALEHRITYLEGVLRAHGIDY